jgi:hypothetical protein
MAKKVSICFRDDFKPGEFARLSSLVIRALHTEFPGFIVHTDAVKKFRESFIVYVYGIWGEGDPQPYVDAAYKTVERLFSNVSWRQEHQPAFSTSEMRGELVVATQGSQSEVYEE